MIYTVACIYLVSLLTVYYSYMMLLRGLKKQKPEEVSYLFRSIPYVMYGSMLFLGVSAFCTLWEMTH